MADSVAVAVKVSWRGTPKFPERYAAAVEKIARDVAAQWQQNVIEVGAVDTGAYVNSIMAERITDETWSVHDGVEHGIYVEFGTHHMPARPCAQPALALIKNAAPAAFRGLLT